MSVLPHRTNVLAFIFTRSPSLQFLFLKRTPERSSYWQPVCGGLDSGESLNSALKREIREETGITKILEIIDLDISFKYQEIKNHTKMQMEDHCFAIEIINPIPINLSSEHSEYLWLSRDKVPQYFIWDLGLEAFRVLLKKI